MNSSFRNDWRCTLFSGFDNIVLNSLMAGKCLSTFMNTLPTSLLFFSEESLNILMEWSDMYESLMQIIQLAFFPLTSQIQLVYVRNIPMYKLFHQVSPGLLL